MPPLGSARSRTRARGTNRGVRRAVRGGDEPARHGSGGRKAAHRHPPTEQISEVMADVLNESHHQHGMGAVVEAQEQALVDFLVNEHPQTAALILSKLRPASAASHCPDARGPAHNLIRRMAALKPVSASAMRLLESSMHDALLTVLSKNATNETNVRIADILNRMGARSSTGS